MTNVIDSRLTLLKRVQGGSNPRGLYLCKCGNAKEIKMASVNTGVTKSCGCLQVERRNINAFRTHGLSKHPVYRVWNAMKDRCYRVKSEDYPDYGARGVIVCDEWKRDFKAFYDWAISNGWGIGLQIDKDLKAKEAGVLPLIYSPEWCQFVTPEDNSNGRRSNRIIEYRGEMKTLKEWSAILGIHRSTLTGRLKRNNYVLNDIIARGANVKKNGEHRKIITRYG